MSPGALVLLLQVCFCKDGADECQVAGTCNTDGCARIQGALTLANSAVQGRTACGAAGDAACASGMECQRTPWSTFTCSGGVVSRNNFTGYCVEAAPSLGLTQLTSDAATIEVRGKWVLG